MNLRILQAHAPTVEKVGDSFYGKLYPTDHTPKKVILKMIGNFNAKVEEDPNLSVGKFRLENLIDGVAWLIDFWVEYGLIILLYYLIYYSTNINTGPNPWIKA